MPTYDYQCQACHHAFEKYQEITARKLRTCPVCGKKRLQRLIGAGAGVIFKGSGFYETDYKRSSRGGGKNGANGSSAPTESAAPAKSEAAPKSAKPAKAAGKGDKAS